MSDYGSELSRLLRRAATVHRQYVRALAHARLTPRELRAPMARLLERSVASEATTQGLAFVRTAAELLGSLKGESEELEELREDALGNMSDPGKALYLAVEGHYLRSQRRVDHYAYRLVERLEAIDEHLMGVGCRASPSSDPECHVTSRHAADLLTGCEASEPLRSYVEVSLGRPPADQPWWSPHVLRLPGGSITLQQSLRVATGDSDQILDRKLIEEVAKFLDAEGTSDLLARLYGLMPADMQATVRKTYFAMLKLLKGAAVHTAIEGLEEMIETPLEWLGRYGAAEIVDGLDDYLQAKLAEKIRELEASYAGIGKRAFEKGVKGLLGGLLAFGVIDALVHWPDSANDLVDFTGRWRDLLKFLSELKWGQAAARVFDAVGAPVDGAISIAGAADAVIAGDRSVALGHGLGATAAVVQLLAVLTGSGPVGWVAAGIGLAAFLIVELTRDNPVVDWVKFTPIGERWSTDASDWLVLGPAAAGFEFSDRDEGYSRMLASAMSALTGFSIEETDHDAGRLSITLADHKFLQDVSSGRLGTRAGLQVRLYQEVISHWYPVSSGSVRDVPLATDSLTKVTDGDETTFTFSVPASEEPDGLEVLVLVPGQGGQNWLFRAGAET